jgi:signal transduction histidine kinase/CheY-like chemotaxis protein
MSMLQYPLYDFLATVRNCLETTTLAVVLEIFDQEQCDRLVVVNEQQCLVGLLHSARLLSLLLAADRGDRNSKFLDLQQPISSLGQSLIEPIQTIPATCRVDQFCLFLRSQKSQSKSNLDWALIDSDGKFLGLLDAKRLLQLLAKQKGKFELIESKSYQNRRQKAYANAKGVPDVAAPKNYSRGGIQKERHPLGHKPLVQLLERLPWPLMLQTSTGEVVAQNPAWWQQLGALKDPEGVRRQVETILAPTPNKKSEYVTQKASNGNGANLSVKRAKSAAPPNNLGEQLPSETQTASRCFWDSQMGTCTCVVEVQNGQERIWQFAKIPLDSPELKIISGENELPVNTDLWLVLATDVTEQQQLCKELAAKNADLIQLNRLKDEFLACISHELKTPLTAVLGLSRLLVDRQLGELNERQARYAGLIHQSGRHLMSVVNDILDLTRMETGQMELTVTPFKLRAVCDRAISEAKTIHSQSSKAVNSQPKSPNTLREHQFTLSIEPGLDQIVADELRLRQMLVHLLSNAFKFTETGGEIGLLVSRWEGWIAFTVWDTGIGIPEHQQHLIFQKFQQLENPLTRQFEGTGLGLVLTRALARLHGGDVSFLSKEGKGSQFTLLLPPSPPNTGFADQEVGRWTDSDSETLETETRETKVQTDAEKWGLFTPTRLVVPPSSPHQPTGSQRLVLVVEAVALYIEELTEQLTGLGYRVVIARSGTEAVEKARRLQPKAIFLNPLLPLLSGWDVLTLLKSDVATSHIPVIVTATGAEKEQAFANSADGFLSLPVQHQFLTPLLDKLCVVEVQQPESAGGQTATNNNPPLRILRLVNHEFESINFHPSLREHRVVEVDDLDQAELLARVWRFDVLLLDAEIPSPETYLEILSQHPRLAALPLVTCNVATTQAASQLSKLTVFPCLTPFATDKNSSDGKTEALLSVLQIAAGISCPPSILVVDLSMFPDLPEVRRKSVGNSGTKKHTSASSVATEINTHCPAERLKPLTICRGSEWFQALIQYLQTAGLKAAMGRSWEELLQQIRHKSVDLVLICLGESPIEQEVHKALKALGQLPFELPPILVLDQRLNAAEVEEDPEKFHQETENQARNFSEPIETLLDAIAIQTLPRSISMEDLLSQINQALAIKGQN